MRLRRERSTDKFSLEKRLPRILHISNEYNILEKLVWWKLDNAAALDRSGIETVKALGGDGGETSFYFYFPRLDAAQRVAEQLRLQGFSAAVDRAALGTDWLVLARRTLPNVDNLIEALRESFELMAKAEGGVYDGWEVELTDPELDHL